MHRKKRHLKSNLILAITLILIVFLVVSLLLIEKTVRGNRTDSAHKAKTVWHNGVAYYPRQDVTSILIMGIDRTGTVVDSGSYNNSGSADAVMLAIFDESSQTFDVLALNRDSMVDIPVLGINGRPVGTINAQLALSHTYGSGLQDSSENALKTVSDLLCGVTIDYYVTMNMDVVSILNDAVGGVRVNVTDDFSGVDSSIPMGEVVLNGEQALNFIQIRKGVSDELNISRMKRQKEYMNGFIEAIQGSNNDNVLDALEIYDDIEPYVVTNCSDVGLSSLLDKFGNYQLADIITPEGENIKGETYMEFHLDKNALVELTLELLYEPK